MQNNEFTQIKNILRELEDKIDKAFIISNTEKEGHLVQLAHKYGELIPSDAVDGRLVTSEDYEGIPLDPNSEDIINLLYGRLPEPKGPRIGKLQENAQFILASSEKTERYSQEILSEMRKAYECGNFQNVMNTAFQQDAQSRKQQHEQKTKERNKLGCNDPISKEEHDQSLLVSGTEKDDILQNYMNQKNST